MRFFIKENHILSFCIMIIYYYDSPGTSLVGIEYYYITI